MSPVRPTSDNVPHVSYIARWKRLSRAAWLYLLHAALLTGSLAISSLLFNLAVLALGYPRSFLGVLSTLSLGVAAMLSLPLWWLVMHIGLRWVLLISATLQAMNAFVFVLWPAATPLLIGSAVTGAATVLFQISAAPFMMRQSDSLSRDHLFSANAAVNVSLAGLGSLVAGRLPEVLGGLLHVGAESAVAYRATFAVAGAGLVLSLVPLLLISERRTGETVAETKGREQSRRYSVVGAVEDQEPATDRNDRTSYISHFRLHALLDRLPVSCRGLIRRPGPLLRLLTPPFLISCGAALLVPYLNLFFKERFGVADSLLGLIFAGLGIVTGVTVLAGPIISARIGKIRTVVVTQALSIPFLLILGFVPLLSVAVGAALARTALFNMGAPLYDAFAMERTDEAARPAVIGLINGAYGAGYVVMPLISTRVQERYGFMPLFVATAACYALAVLASYVCFAWTDARRATVDAEPTVV